MDWAAPIPWSTGEWLEVWDSLGKAEFPIYQQSPAIPIQSLAQAHVSQDDLKSEKSRKRPPGIPKKRSRPAKESGHSTAEQGNLMIEIVDDKAREITPGEIEPSDPPESANETVKDQHDRRE
jgi:hypothetical protein